MGTYRKYRVIKKIFESDTVVSLYLEPTDGLALSPYKPGQHLQFRLSLPGQAILLYRNYSFSDVFHPSYYRVSVKKELPPRGRTDLSSGLVSSHLFDSLQTGDLLEAKGPQGTFCLDPNEKTPVVFFAGGIGITPLLCMVKTLAAVNPDRPVYFIYGVNERKDHAFREELQLLAVKHPSFRFLVFYAVAGGDDKRGVDFDYNGFIDMEVLAGLLPGHPAAHYICGPRVMMDVVRGALLQQGVPEQKIHIEAFDIPADDPAPDEDAVQAGGMFEAAAPASAPSVHFRISGKNITWDPAYPSLLVFAEASGIEISSGCLFGDCGTCLTKLVSGEVRYIHPTLVQPSPESCLPCSCVPVSDLILDA